MSESALAREPSFTVQEVDAPDDLLALVAPEAEAAPTFFWAHPDQYLAVLGLGVAAEVRTAGPERFTEASRQALALLAEASVGGDGGESAPRPCVVGGFAFEPGDPRDRSWREFPACRLVVPAKLWLRRGERCWLIQVGDAWAGAGERGSRRRDGVRPERAGSAEQESRRGWIARVDHALELVGRGALDKVVLTRSRQFTADDGLDVAAAVSKLCRLRPSCISYWMAGGSTDFFGSTPEQLVRCDGLEFETESVAGTAARGGDEAEDAALARELLASEKDCREQALVSEAIGEALAAVAGELRADPAPSVRSVPEAHHLATVIRGRLRERMSALELAGLLHPTPAVCGSPQAKAYDLICNSDAERGWFTGGIGWMDARGDGRFAVALRSALVEEGRVTTAAGAGIVAGSDPEAEFEETEVKMRGLQAVLEAGVR